MASDEGVIREKKTPQFDTGPRMLVAAIDFGTTYSGYAYSFASDFQENPMKIYSQNLFSGSVLYTAGQSSVFKSETGKKQHDKVSTSVLFNPNKEFVAFGFEADDAYAKMIDGKTKEANDWYYFNRFKMSLHSTSTLSRTMPVMDFTHKKSMPAIDVFAACIKYLKGHLMETLTQRRTTVTESEISWVLTVPAIWDDQARQFMREAAAKGGIPGEQLILALEPEAASVYCHYLSLHKNSEGQSGIPEAQHLMDIGKKFIVVDCGGGTVDLTVYEVQAGDKLRTLRELYRPTGGAWGGTKVDDAFKNFLGNLVGFDHVQKFKRLHMLELYREFEQAKRLLNQGSKTLAMKLPDSIKEVFLEEEIQQKLKETDGVSLVRNRLSISSEIAKKLFEKPIESILGTIDSILTQDVTRGVDTIVMVGGFSESVVLQAAVKEKFYNYTVIVPEEPATAVLKGAVQFRHDPKVIGFRASAYTYGVRSSADFRDGVHDRSKKRVIQGNAVCMDIFNPFIRVNEVVKVNDLVQMQTFSPLYKDQKTCTLKIYRTGKRDPTYTTEEDCEEIGQLDLQLDSAIGDRDRVIVVTAMVGGTELKFMAVEAATLKVCSVTQTFLDRDG